ncbi:nuclear pore complex protein NUP58-like [Rutidosis leptorrhynchoides]|uniref:nuclear pore complex protein NUP58-like n=1 Tax=Rutidosis leptorrhynchoides TaxID=125765 RepID=UPI003A998728
MAFSFTPQQQQQPSIFQPQQQQQQQSPFQPSGVSSFFQPQQQQQQQLLQQQQQQQLQQQQQQQNQLFLFTNDKTPASYGTKWADLHPDSQKFLLLIEERILEYRDESQRLDQCGRFYDSSVSNEGFELDASHIIQELGGISTAMDRQKVLLQNLASNVKDMLRNTEIAVRSFMILRSKFNYATKTSAVTTATTQPTTTSDMVPVYDFYSGMPQKPSPFLQQTVARFEKYLAECRQWIEELEQLLLLESNKNASNSNSSLLQSLPKVMTNVHDFFVYVAAKVESIHQYMESMKTAYLADQRERGDGNDPFIEADRREIAKQAAAARRIHPTLHLPSNSQSSTQVVASSAAPATSATPPAASASTATTASGLFSSPFPAASSSSLFSTPAASAPSFSLFASSGASPQTSIFGVSSSTTPSLFNSTPAAASTFSMPFATNPSTGASAFSTTTFATNPTAGTSTFSTPFGTGAATGSGTSFNTLSKSRAKSRSGRR